MDPVIVRGLKIGEGMPKICVPIVGITEKDILNKARQIPESAADLVEWRADWFEDVFDENKRNELLEHLRSILGNIPLLYTFRSKNEGGEKEISVKHYIEMNCQVAETGLVDLIDVEMFMDEFLMRETVTKIKETKVQVVGSNHHFHETPKEEEIIRRLNRMQELGADILKIAVMPHSNQDVLTLMSATDKMVSYHAKKPIVTMAMSKLGMISRISGEIFGSSITFGLLDKASAPGQIPAEDLKKILEIMHDNGIINI